MKNEEVRGSIADCGLRFSPRGQVPVLVIPSGVEESLTVKKCSRDDTSNTLAQISNHDPERIARYAQVAARNCF